MPVRLFLSYARSDDEPFVGRLCASLKAAGFDVWFDRVSMPSRQLTFHQEIRDAVTACDRLILVIGPNAVASDYVMQEWRFAYFEGVKCVNPIVRLDGIDAAGKKIDGYSLIPEDLHLIHAEDFRDDVQFEAHVANLIRQLSDPLPPAGKLVAVPELPPHYLDQPARLAALRDILLTDLQKPIVVSGAAARVGLQGMGGIGKSVLASALAHRPEVRRAFPDGVYWVTLGQEPNVADLQRELARALGDEGLFTGTDAGKEKLRELLGGRAALLVLDDVWQRGHAEAFNVLGPRGRLLLTTRDSGLVTALAAKENHYQVQLPTEAEAEALLVKAAGVQIQELPAEARQIVAECGRLPLGLALCGGMVNGGRAWQDVLDALREHDLEYLSDSHPAEEQHRSIWKAMDASIRALPEEERERFAELAVFAQDIGAPVAAVETLWGHTAGLTPRRARGLLMSFRQRSLIDFDQTTRRMTLHDLLHNFATGIAGKRFGSPLTLHRRLLDAYWGKCPNGWPSGPDDGYFLQSLIGHLLATGETEDAVALLTDLPWIEAKCKTGRSFELQEDYRQTIEVLPEAQAELAEDRRRQERIAKYTRDLVAYAKGEIKALEVPNLIGPWSDERIRAEARRIRENPTALGRLRSFAGFVERESYPLAEFGTRPGFVVQHAFNSDPAGPVHAAAGTAAETISHSLLLRVWPKNAEYVPTAALLRTLKGHSNQVNSAALTPDGLVAVTGSSDKTLRLWNLRDGRCLRVLEGHTEDVTGVSITPDGRWAVSGSCDRTVRVWDLEHGQCTAVLKGHSEWVRAVATTPDLGIAVSAGDDKTLRVWDPRNSSCLSVLAGHSDKVEAVTVTADGRRAVSGSRDGNLRIWDLEAAKCLHSLEGHAESISALSATPDGHLVVSGSWDRTLRVWDLETGHCVLRLQGHTDFVDGVAVTPDGKIAVSGGRDRTLRIWDLEKGQTIRVLGGVDGTKSGVQVTPDGWMAIAGPCVWNLESGCTLRDRTGNVRMLSMIAEGRRVVSGTDHRTLRVWDLESGELQRTTEGVCHWGEDGTPQNSADAFPVASAGSYAVSTRGYELRVWELESGKECHTLNADKYRVQSVSLTADGRRCVSGGWDQAVRVWDLESGDCLYALEGHSGWINAVSITADGHRAVSGSSDKTVRVWDLVNGQCLRVLEGHGSIVKCIALTPDGRWAVSGSYDHTLRLWDLGSGQCQHVLEGHENLIESVSIAPDGSRAVSVQFCGSEARLWNLQTGQCLRTLGTADNAIWCARIASEGRLAATASRDGVLSVWNLHSGNCVAALPGHSLRGALVLSSDGRYYIGGDETSEIAIFKLTATGES